ncbi:unnamed protein product [Mytilus edulis]|uniref:DDE Tnp4 domain-containing protein n=1 Tax=Mytilus edulis TaxID=6550 RepID=A0A8S3UIG0_MYTED|nr:unnamed protein product [Mytilus edulis]
MPGSGPKSHPCVLCNKRTKPHERRSINKSVAKYLKKNFLITHKQEDKICNTCRHKYYVKETRPSPVVQHLLSDDEDYVPPAKRRSTVLSSPPSVSLSIPSTSKSHSYCFICKKPGPKLIVVPSQARFSTFLKKEVIIPAGCRCCPGHLTEDTFTEDAISKINCTNDNVILNRSTIMDLLKKLRYTALQNEQSRIDFDTDKVLSDSDFINLTGINKDNFNDLHSYIKTLVRNTPTRSTRTSLGIFLFKLKSGISNKVLSTIFNISRSSLREAISCVRQALVQNFVPQNLGFKHISHDDVVNQHTRPLAQTLFGDGTNTQAILVLDGTYIYIQKSGNFHFQRRSYSLHKGRPLVKPMVVVTTTGYFVTVLGPYFADCKNNDAAILKHMLNTNVEDIKEWVQDNDVFVVDRGFRDSLELLDDLGIKSQMPSFLTKGQKQMTTDEANASRLVTKVRWVVESANARIKRWKYLSHVLPNKQVPYIGDYVCIVCGISNKYLPPLSPGCDNEEALAAKMLYLSKRVNTLKQRVEEENLERRKTIWKEPDNILDDFPLLDEEDLRNITCGVYQIKLSTSYIQEHLEGNCQILVHKEDDHLIRVKLQSRHVSSKTYILWIEYTSAEITAWYCKCRAGARVVGVCAHIASILWYLGYARHNQDISYGVQNWGAYLEDAASIPQAVDESDSEESVIEE